MKMVQLKYGKEKMVLEIPDQNLVGILEANLMDNKQNHETDEQGEIQRALHQPIGTPRLKELVKSGQKIVIMVSDVTRPAPPKKCCHLCWKNLQWQESGMKM